MYGAYSSEVGHRIHEYTRRKLGNQADILNAFQGILGHLAQGRALPVYNIWGIPIVGRWHYKDGTHHLPKDFLAGICWKLELPSRRRHGFPSWSLAGWIGTVLSSYAENAIRSSASEDTDITVSFEAPDGIRTELSQIEPPLGSGSNNDHLRIMVLDCRPFTLRAENFRSRGLSDGEELTGSTEVLQPVSSDVLTSQICYLSEVPSSPKAQLLGIPIGLVKLWESEPRLFVLVVEKKTELWERVGHFEWSNPGGPADFRSLINNIHTTRTVLRIG
jgi:hypothetical protein